MKKIASKKLNNSLRINKNNQVLKYKKSILFLTLLIFSGYIISTFYSSKINNIFSPAKPTINEITNCPKTICTRKTDGRKDCTTYECPAIKNGVSTVKISSEIRSDTAGVNKVVEYKYDVVKTAPVNKEGIQTGNSTTVEVRTKVDPKTKDEEILSTVTTIQKPTVLDSKGAPIAPGEVVKEIRTGDISLGVSSYQSGDKDKKSDCEKLGKQWVDSACVAKDLRTPEQKCTQDVSGKATGNTWNSGQCIMKIEPRVFAPASTTSTGVNCDKGTCSGSGSPICYGSYASTGQYLKDSTGNSTGEYDCRLCGDNGSGGVGFTGGPQSCKSLLASNQPVVLGFDANPSGLGLPEGTHTGSCMSKRGGDWVLTGVGQPGEGPNEGKFCDVTGNWISTPPVIVTNPKIATPKSAEALCHSQHPGYIFGKNFSGEEVCLPRNNVNISMLANQDPCVAGLGKLEGKEVWIECSTLGSVKAYTFCYGGTGIFDENGKCLPSSSTATDALTTGIDLNVAGNGFRLAVDDKGQPLANGYFNVQPFIRGAVSGAVGCISGGTLGLFAGPIGVIGGCAAGATAAASGTVIGNNAVDDSNVEVALSGNSIGMSIDEKGNPSINTKINPKSGVFGGALGCVGGAITGLIAGPMGSLGGCAAGAIVGVGGVAYGSSKNPSNLDGDSTKDNDETSETPNNSSTTNGLLQTPDAPGQFGYDSLGAGTGALTMLAATAGPCTVPIVIPVAGIPLSVACRIGAAAGGALFGNKAGDYIYSWTH